MLNRRQFILTIVPAVGLGLLGARSAYAQANRLSESDPTAVALGYKDDATKVDAKKFTTYKPGNGCSSCTLFQGKAGDATAPCGAFGGKLVSAKGWCAAYIKKA